MNANPILRRQDSQRVKCMNHAGVTLIELLAVVAIVTLLAAVAIPNYLAAQLRAKVSRAQEDLRTIATALEIYRIDNESYPSMVEPGFMGGPPIIQGSELKWWYVPNVLTTPIPYLSSSNLWCPFGGNYDKSAYFPDEIWRRYGYENIPELILKAQTWPIFQRRYPPGAIQWSGSWRLQSVGPDRVWNPSEFYDPSNGVISNGDIIRTQLDPTGNRPHTLN